VSVDKIFDSTRSSSISKFHETWLFLFVDFSTFSVVSNKPFSLKRTILLGRFLVLGFPSVSLSLGILQCPHSINCFRFCQKFQLSLSQASLVCSLFHGFQLRFSCVEDFTKEEVDSDVKDFESFSPFWSWRVELLEVCFSATAVLPSYCVVFFSVWFKCLVKSVDDHDMWSLEFWILSQLQMKLNSSSYSLEFHLFHKSRLHLSSTKNSLCGSCFSCRSRSSQRRASSDFLHRRPCCC